MSTSEIFLIAMLIIFALPYFVWRAGGTDYYAPLVVVQIITGLLLGPGVLGAVFPSAFSFIFNPQVTGALNGIAWWAVMLFVFAAGIELDLKEVWANRRETSITAGLALGTPLLTGCAAALVMLAFDTGWAGPKGAAWQVVLGLGMACAVTALPILVLFLEKLEILRQPLGQRILRYASLDDIAIWAILALILLDWDRVTRQMAFLAAFGGAGFGLRQLMRRAQPADRWYLSLIWLAATGFAADWSGLHFMVGAFLAGAVLDASLFDQKQMDRFREHILLAMMPVYFLSTGLRTNFQAGGLAAFAAAAVLLAASVGGKLAGLHLAGWILKWEKGEAAIIGWLLQTKALIMLIFVTVLLDKGIISSQTFTAALLMAVASTMLSVPMAAPLLRRYKSVVFKQS